jgi:hypothetical protein
MRFTGRIGVAIAACSAVVLLGGSAQAVPQFTPSATALVHTIGSGESGVVWNTGGVGVNGQVVYDKDTSSLVLEGEVDVMNYYDPAGSCPTDAGSNCSFNYGPNLDMTVLATFIGSTITPLGGGLYDILLDFESTGGTDILWTDPADGDSVMLEASWTAGTFLGNPTPGLQVSALFCDGVGGCGPAGIYDGLNNEGDPLVIGFALIESGSLYESLWDSDSNPFTQTSIMLDLSELFDFDPDIATIGGELLDTGLLPDFTGEDQGQIYRLETGDFVIPEPGTALLFGLGLAGVGVARRRICR